MKCLACDVDAGRVAAPGGVIYQDAHWIADHGVDCLVQGYDVLKSLRHVHEMADLVPDEAATLVLARRRSTSQSSIRPAGVGTKPQAST
jgi:diadenosine tetraphosphate (Ap4A) HIT family hydrolase